MFHGHNSVLMSNIAIEERYSSPPRRVSLPARLFPGVVFYLKLAGLIILSGWRAVRGTYDDKTWDASSRGVMSALESVGVRVEIENTAAFRNLEGPCVFVGNHMSTFEGLVYPCIINPHRRVTYIIKKDLMKMPVLKHIFRSRDPILVSRKNPREDLREMLEGGEERLRRNISIIVFPQTTRTTEFDPEAFNSAGVKLARRAGVPIIPVAVRSDAWGCGRLVRDIGKIDPEKTIRLCFGEPLTVTGSGKEQHEACVDFIAQKLESWNKG